MPDCMALLSDDATQINSSHEIFQLFELTLLIRHETTSFRIGWNS